MKLLHILSQRPGRSGSGVFLQAMVRQAALSGLQQHVIVTGPSAQAQELPGLAPDALSCVTLPQAAAPFDAPGNSDVMPYPSTVFSQMTPLQVEQYLHVARATLLKARQQFAPDVIHTHHLWLMSALAREVFPDTPIIATSHNVCLRLAHTAPHLAARVIPQVQSFERVALLTPQSQSDVQRVFGVAPERVRLLGSGYDAETFCHSHEGRDALLARLQAQSGLDLASACAGCKIVCFIGRLSPAKGIPYLLQALAALRAAGHQNLRLVLIGAMGSGSEGARMGELLQPLGEMVIHTGALPHSAIKLILQACDLFVLPSLFEGLPLVMLEALACGAPSLLSRLPTIASWVPADWEHSGLLHWVQALQVSGADTPVAADEARYSADLAHAILHALQQKPNAAARDRFASQIRQHSWRAVFARYLAQYEEMLQHKAGA
jgi:glycosyltransferase involved in cell wall biosynthesis